MRQKLSTLINSHAIRLCATVGVCLAVTGCAAQNAQDVARTDRDPVLVTAPPEVTATPTIDSIDSLTLPIEAFTFTPTQLRQVNNAQTSLINQCAARFGLTPQLPRGSSLSPSPLASQYGVVDEAIAAKYGYHEPAASTGTNKPTSGGRPSKDLALVLYGSNDPDPDLDATKPTGLTFHGQEIPPGGCYGESRRKLGITAFERLNSDNLADQIRLKAGHQADNDQRVTAVMGTWSACMKQKGYQYGSPADVGVDPKLKASLAGPVPSAVEVQIALTDVGCKKSSNLIGVWFAVEVAYEKVAIQQNLERLVELRKAMDAMVTLAAKVSA